MANENVTKVEGSLLVGLGSAIAGVVVATGVSLYITGTTQLEIAKVSTSLTTPVVYSTGGLMPVVASLSEDNFAGHGVVDGSGSGWSIQNPYSEKVLCKGVTINVTTAAAPTTRVDVSRGTGALTVAGVTSGSTLFDNLVLNAAVHVASGSLVARYENSFGAGTGSIWYPKNFVLDEAGGANDYLLLAAYTGTGGGIAADVHAECYSLD